jgi:hypothetical protein
MANESIFIILPPYCDDVSVVVAIISSWLVSPVIVFSSPDHAVARAQGTMLAIVICLVLWAVRSSSGWHVLSTSMVLVYGPVTYYTVFIFHVLYFSVLDTRETKDPRRLGREV